MKKALFSTLLASVAVGIGAMALVSGNTLNSANAEGEAATWITTIQCDFSEPQGWGGVTSYKFHGWNNEDHVDVESEMYELSNGLFTCDVCLNDSQSLRGGQFILVQNGVKKWSLDMDFSVSKESHSKVYSSAFVGNWQGDKYECQSFSSSNVLNMTNGVVSYSFAEDASDAQYKISEIEIQDTTSVYNFTIGSSTYGDSIIKTGCKDLVVHDEGGFKFAQPGTYTIYYSSTANDGFVWISKKAAPVTYELKVNDSVYSLVKNGESSTEYVTTETVTVNKGDVIACYADGVLQTINPKLIGNNNCWSDEGVTTVLLNMTAKIYVDFEAGTIFCGGMTYGNFGMVVNDNYVALSQNENPADPTYTEWVKTGFTFTKNDVIRFVDNTSSSNLAVIFDVTKINTYSISNSFAVIDGRVKCIAEDDVETDIYVKFKSGADEIYFGSVSEDDAAARAFARRFNSEFEEICKYDNTTNEDTLVNAWNYLVIDFADLIESAQIKLVYATTSSLNSDLAAFAAKYDYIYSRYGEDLSLINFASRTVSAKVINVNSENTSVALLVVAAIATVSLAGFVLFAAKRKKVTK